MTLVGVHVVPGELRKFAGSPVRDVDFRFVAGAVGHSSDETDAQVRQVIDQCVERPARHDGVVDIILGREPDNIALRRVAFTARQIDACGHGCRDESTD